MIRFGFRSRAQLPLFMVWREYRDDNGNVNHATVIFNSMNWIGI